MGIELRIPQFQSCVLTTRPSYCCFIILLLRTSVLSQAEAELWLFLPLISRGSCGRASWSLLSLVHPSATCQLVSSCGILISSDDGRGTQKRAGFSKPSIERGDATAQQITFRFVNSADCFWKLLRENKDGKPQRRF